MNCANDEHRLAEVAQHDEVGLHRAARAVDGRQRHAARGQRRADGAAEVELAAGAAALVDGQPGGEPPGQRLHLAAQRGQLRRRWRRGSRPVRASGRSADRATAAGSDCSASATADVDVDQPPRSGRAGHRSSVRARRSASPPRSWPARKPSSSAAISVCGDTRCSVASRDHDAGAARTPGYGAERLHRLAGHGVQRAARRPQHGVEQAGPEPVAQRVLQRSAVRGVGVTRWRLASSFGGSADTPVTGG